MSHKQDIADAISGGKRPQLNPDLIGKESEVSSEILCIYHGNCADGFGAAWAMRHHMPKANIKFIPATYGDEPPDVKNRIVYILDFSYKREVIAKMLTEAATFLLLDHHKSAMLDLMGLDDASKLNQIHTQERDNSTRTPEFWISDGGRIVFDMNKSGAGMAWDYFSHGAPRPPIIDHIEDRDLWKFKLDGTREIQAALFSYPYDFEVWDSLLTAPAYELKKEGGAIERKHFKDIKELLLVSTREMNIAGYKVPVANLPYTMSSDACHILMEHYPEAPFAACYFDAADERRFSLRSEEGRVDVSQVAVAYGGGGHRNAAGFSQSLEFGGESDGTTPESFIKQQKT